jgi:CHASE2 domain-containing sensor protein
MKREFIYERRQTAGRMEAVTILVTGVALVGSIFAFLSYGWLPSLGLLILGSVAFALSRLFNLIGDLFASIHSTNESTRL